MDVSDVGSIYVTILRVGRSMLLLFQVDNLMHNSPPELARNRAK